MGFVGIIVMLWPYLDLAQYAAGGSATAAATVGAVCGLLARLHQRRLGDPDPAADRHRDHVVDRVLFLAVSARSPGSPPCRSAGSGRRRLQLAALIAAGVIGGLAHIVLTESYRYAPASLVAPFDYTTMIWAFVLGYSLFGEMPTIYVFVGGAIVAASGLFVIWRERQLGLRRVREAEGPGERGVRRQNALKVMMVRVSWMPGMTCTFSFTKWPMSVPVST